MIINIKIIFGSLVFSFELLICFFKGHTKDYMLNNAIKYHVGDCCIRIYFVFNLDVFFTVKTGFH